MRCYYRHDWDLSPPDAIRIQRQLAKKIVRTDKSGLVKSIAGIDVGFRDEGKTTCAAIVILEYPSLKLIETKTATCKTSFPYIPGLLSFRELPAIIKALDKVDRLPDLCMCDGQGYAHPRRFGIACHLGIITGLPSLGVAKTRLIGTSDPVPNKRGEWVPLYDKNEIIGAVLRTRVDVKPVYISVGHKVDLASAIAYVMNCTTRYRLPETIRLADKFASSG